MFIKRATNSLEFGSGAPGAASGLGDKPNTGAISPATAPLGQSKPVAKLNGPVAAPVTAPPSQSKPTGGFNFKLNMPQLKLPFGITPADVAQHGLPNQWQEAHKWYQTTQDSNRTWTDPGKWDAAEKLNSWFEQNKNHGLVSKIYSDPTVRQHLDTYRGPMGQVGKTIAPAVGSYFGDDPKRLATLLAVPGVKEMFHGTLGQMGTPGLALAQSYLSGNMKNWNTLFGKQANRLYIQIYNSKNKRDVIDHHIDLMRSRIK